MLLGMKTKETTMKTIRNSAIFMLLLTLSFSAFAENLNGTYTLEDGSAYWVFGNGSGSFWQVKSINGNPGKIVIDFDYSIDGSTLNYTQTRISLRDHPDAKSKRLNKTLNEQIEVRSDRVVLGGKHYYKG